MWGKLLIKKDDKANTLGINEVSGRKSIYVSYHFHLSGKAFSLQYHTGHNFIVLWNLSHSLPITKCGITSFFKVGLRSRAQVEWVLVDFPRVENLI
jgi:hypothetical protein